jgi:hypothetical protein
MDLNSWGAPIAGAMVTGGLGLLTWALTRRSDLVDQLRQALDRGRIRENALVTVCDILITLIDHIEEPTQPMIELRKRAHDVLVDARRHTHRKGDQ